ncbi:MAG TPA: hypothetical protein VFV33_15055 [Gemmatimonadaceae bacterium]|nr:hypothetical protein [Gemmatimonadaceae bacterium]
MSTAAHPLIEATGVAPSPAPGPFEQFQGYGILGVPFASGHVLAMRRFSASSVGPGYDAVWHRRPDGGWWFYSDVPPGQSCARYFGRALECVVHTEVRVEWRSPTVLHIAVPLVQLDWEVTLGTSLVSRALTAILRRIPAGAARHPSVLSILSWGAGACLRSGRVQLAGTAPNGQRFLVAPRGLAPVRESRASIAGHALGVPRPLAPQARLGDFWIPQRGWFAVGLASFDRFDPARHADAVTCRGRPAAVGRQALHPTRFAASCEPA